MERIKNIDWDASSYFEGLTSKNKLSKDLKFRFCRVSGLEGFSEAVNGFQNTANFVCVSDIGDGYTDVKTAPMTRRVKTVYLAMRHKVDDMRARNRCMEQLRELFRQLMSAFLQEKTRLEEKNIYPDPRISFREIDRYFLSGCACAFFTIAVSTYTDLSYDPDEWD